MVEAVYSINAENTELKAMSRQEESTKRCAEAVDYLDAMIDVMRGKHTTGVRQCLVLGIAVIALQKQLTSSTPSIPPAFHSAVKAMLQVIKHAQHKVKADSSTKKIDKLLDDCAAKVDVLVECASLPTLVRTSYSLKRMMSQDRAVQGYSVEDAYEALRVYATNQTLESPQIARAYTYDSYHDHDVDATLGLSGINAVAALKRQPSHKSRSARRPRAFSDASQEVVARVMTRPMKVRDADIRDQYY